MKQAVAVLMLGFGIALAVIIGQRMSTDAMAVVIGVAVGVAASVPTSILMVALLRRSRGAGFAPEPTSPPASAPQLQQPNFIMLSPDMFGRQAQQPYLPLPPAEYDVSQDGGLRRLRVVGGDDDWVAGE